MAGTAVRGFRDYLLERVVKSYVENVDDVLTQFSIRKLLFGSIRLDEVHLKPEACQDLGFSSLPYACEIVKLSASNVVVTMDWMSIASKSVRIHIPTLKLDLVVHDPNDTSVPSSLLFWEEQRLRGKAEAVSMSTPGDVSLVTKVAGGLNIVVDNIEVSVRAAESDEPSLGCSLGGLCYCPATSSGVPTMEIDEAIRPNLRQREVAYSYHCEIGSMNLSSLPGADATEANLCMQGFRLTSNAQTAAYRKRESFFYMSSSMGIDIQELRTPRPVPLGRLASLVAVLSRIGVSNILRETGDTEVEPEEEAGGCQPDEIANLMTPMASMASMDSQTPRSSARARDRAGTETRLRSRTETQGDISNLLAGCSRTLKKSPTLGEGSLSAACASDEESAGDSDDFRDCDEFGMDTEDFRDCQELKTSASRNDGMSESWTLLDEDVMDRVALTRLVLDIGQCDLQVLGNNGVVAFKLAKVSHSSDSRCQLSELQLKGLRALFDLPEASTTTPVLTEGIGIIYAGLSMKSLELSFEATAGGRSELAQLRNGLSLRHKGMGEPCRVAEGAQQLLEVEISGLTLCDKGREEIEAIGTSLAAAVTTAPKSLAPAIEEVAMPICYRFEALDVSVHAGPSVGQPMWYCSVPQIRLSNVVDDFDEVWKCTLKATRALGEPLGTTPAGNPNALGSAAWVSASEAIAKLERQLTDEKLVSRRQRRTLRGTLILLLGGAVVLGMRRSWRRS